MAVSESHLWATREPCAVQTAAWAAAARRARCARSGASLTAAACQPPAARASRATETAAVRTPPAACSEKQPVPTSRVCLHLQGMHAGNNTPAYACRAAWTSLPATLTAMARARLVSHVALAALWLIYSVLQQWQRLKVEVAIDGGAAGAGGA
eukprot:jgi/Ulvmu1/1661/UM114_0031.1